MRIRKFKIATTAVSAVFVLQSTQIFAASEKKNQPGRAVEKTEGDQVTLDQLKALIKDPTSATIIDANAESTYDKGRIPNAVSYVKNKTNFAKILPADKGALLVMYCGGPLCTAWEEPAKVAKEMGYTNIKHYKGGLKGWEEAGNTLTR